MVGTISAQPTREARGYAADLNQGDDVHPGCTLYLCTVRTWYYVVHRIPRHVNARMELGFCTATARGHNSAARICTRHRQYADCRLQTAEHERNNRPFVGTITKSQSHPTLPVSLPSPISPKTMPFLKPVRFSCNMQFNLFPLPTSKDLARLWHKPVRRGGPQARLRCCEVHPTANRSTDNLHLPRHTLVVLIWAPADSRTQRPGPCSFLF